MTDVGEGAVQAVQGPGHGAYDRGRGHCGGNDIVGSVHVMRDPSFYPAPRETALSTDWVTCGRSTGGCGRGSQQRHADR